MRPKLLLRIPPTRGSDAVDSFLIGANSGSRRGRCLRDSFFLCEMDRFRFWIDSAPCDFTPYQKIIDENNLQDFCLLHTKFIPQEDVAHYYCASDLVVLPYKKVYQSGVLMMTLSYEKPTLVSNLPPLKEILKDNENGFLFESENSSSLVVSRG